MKQILHKTFLLSILVGITSIIANAQNINVKSFYLAESDMTAMDNPVWDQNGSKCALIRIQTTQKGYVFDVGSLGVKKVDENHVGEVWVYVPAGVKHIDIRHAQLGSINGYQIPIQIKPGRSYFMELTTDQIDIIVRHEIRKQVLQFEVTPADEHAIVKVKPQDATEYVLWGEVDIYGKIDRNLDFGSYDYMVTAENHETYYGHVKLSDNKKVQVEKVALKSNFGFLEVSGENGCIGAEVYVNDRKVGTVPYKSKKMECRTDYRITVTLGDLYKPYNGTFSINKGETTKLSPQLQGDFATTTLHVDGGAEIYIDGVSKGTTLWTGPLKAGQYTIVCKKANHRESTKVVSVQANTTESFELPAPIPILGALYVRSTPSGATIKLNDVEVGKTPFSLSEILTGKHKIELSLPNYRTEEHTINVEEGKMATLDVTLNDYAQMTIDSKPSDASLYINSVYVGQTPYNQEMTSGDYLLRLRHHGYRDYESRFHLDSSHPSVTVALKRQYQRKSCFYMQPTFQLGYAMSVGGYVGGYIHNFNIETGYMRCFSGPTAYWNSMDGHSAPISEELRSHNIALHLGYGIIIGSRLRITPQVGAHLVAVGGNLSKSNAQVGVIGCRAEYALAKRFGLSLTPEYGVAFKKSETYKTLVDGGIRNFGAGFNIKLGMNIVF